LARLEGEPPAERGGGLLLLDAHQDTVPADHMTIEPWSATVREGRLYGRGACDVKGGMAAMIAAVARLAAERPAGMPTILLSCPADEEYQFSGVRALTAAWGLSQFSSKRKWDCPLSPSESLPSPLAGEGSGARGKPGARPLQGGGTGATAGSSSSAEDTVGQANRGTHTSRAVDQETKVLLAHRQSLYLPRLPDAAIVAEPTGLDVVVAHKGVIRWFCHARGRAAHSSQPAQGDNAVYRMARVVTAIERYAREVLATRPGHALCGPYTLNVGAIRGGTSVNIVPEQCTIEIEIRVPPGGDPQLARSELIEYLASIGEEGGARNALQHDPPYMVGPALSEQTNAVLAERLVATVREMIGQCRRRGVPYATHAAFYSSLGIPAVVFGPGAIEQAHTADEWISLDQLRQAAEILYRFIRDCPFLPRKS
jgi:acetylornithine deacetylase/succinyl-diaminopimelate desuccinylase-like protein